MRPPATAPLLIALLVSACAPVTAPAPSASALTAPPAPTASRVPTPEPTPALRLRTPQPRPSVATETVVLLYERNSDIPSLHGPELLVAADGQVLSAPSWGRDVSLRRLDAAGVEQLRRFALDTGIFTSSHQIANRPLPGASPNLNRGFETVTITVRSGDRDVRVSAFARDDQEALYRPNPERDAFLALADRLADLSWLPASAWLDRTPQPYAAALHRLYVQTRANLRVCVTAPASGCVNPTVAIPVSEVWPFTVDPGSFGTAVAPDPNAPANVGARCAILTADDARALGVGIARTNGDGYHPERRITSGGYTWPAGNGEVRLRLEPLLPGTPAVCGGTAP